MSVESLLAISPVIPVVTIRDSTQAVPLARALLAGGVAIVEVTLRTPEALHSIERIAREVEGMTVLAGTVCSPAQVDASLQAGAAALVSPGMTDRLAASIETRRAAWLPGVASASDILRGLELGLDRFKLFPAGIVGGTEALRAFAGPFPEVRFCPTGGIERTSAGRYLELANVSCVGGSWVAPDSLISAGDWATISGNARFVASLRPGP